MSDELETETQDAYIEDDKTSENEQETLTAEDNGSDNLEELKKQVATLKAQKEHFKSKFEKIKTSLNDEEPKKEKTKVVDGNDRLDKLELRQIDPSLAEEDIQEILDISKAKNISVSEAYKNPIVQGYLKTKENKQASKDASLTTSRSPKAGANSESLFKPGMSEADKIKAYNQMFRQ